MTALSRAFSGMWVGRLADLWHQARWFVTPARIERRRTRRARRSEAVREMCVSARTPSRLDVREVSGDPEGPRVPSLFRPLPSAPAERSKGR
jgi:hypothetical protein